MVNLKTYYIQKFIRIPFRIQTIFIECSSFHPQRYLRNLKGFLFPFRNLACFARKIIYRKVSNYSPYSNQGPSLNQGPVQSFTQELGPILKLGPMPSKKKAKATCSLNLWFKRCFLKNIIEIGNENVICQLLLF